MSNRFPDSSHTSYFQFKIMCKHARNTFEFDTSLVHPTPKPNNIINDMPLSNQMHFPMK